MTNICIIGPSHLSRNPRLIRNADALSAYGYDVVVVYPSFSERFAELDDVIVRRSSWKAKPIDLLSGWTERLRWLKIRARRKIFSRIRYPDIAFAALRAYGYFGPELFAEARKTGARLFIAQQQETAVAAYLAAKEHSAAFAVDVEDLLSENIDEKSTIVRGIESQMFPRSSFLCTMSKPAADHLASVHRLCAPPIVLHNCVNLLEASNLQSPHPRGIGRPLSLYWFGQTVGPHSCAETILHAIAALEAPVKLTLRGTFAHSDYISKLRHLEKALNLSGVLDIEQGAPPEEMVRLASDHDVCFGTQPGGQLFHELAVGNKVFTGMMAGCAIALSDTVAHRQLLQQHPGWGFLFNNDDPATLVSALLKFIRQPEELTRMRMNAWNVAHLRYNWEYESKALVEAVRNSLSAVELT